MDEKQRKQLEIIHNALSDEHCETLHDMSKKLKELGRDVVNDLSAFDVIVGHSEKMMAANAIMQISRQIDMILTCDAD